MGRKLSRLAAVTNLGVSDRIIVTVNPATLPQSRYITYANLFSQLNASVQIPNCLFVSATYSGLSAPYYTTLAAAKAAWTAGKIIMIGPEILEEDIDLDSDGMILVGSSREKSVIGKLTISAKDCIVRDLTVNDDLNHLTTDTFSFISWNEIINCKLMGKILCGTDAIEDKYGLRFINCYIADCGILLNSASRIWINDCILFNNNSNGIEIYSGIIIINGCYSIDIYSVDYKNTGKYKAILIDNCSQLVIRNAVVNYEEAEIISALAIRQSICKADYSVTGGTPKTWTLTGYFELAILNSSFGMPNIVFDSQNAGRLSNLVGLGCNNPATISGTGLANLHIQKSIFHCAAPDGLGSDQDNLWEAFIDD